MRRVRGDEPTGTVRRFVDFFTGSSCGSLKLFGLATHLSGRTGFELCVAPELRSDQYNSARTEARRDSARSGCKPHQGTIVHRAPPRRFPPCVESPSVWYRAMGDRRKSIDVRWVRRLA